MATNFSRLFGSMKRYFWQPKTVRNPIRNSLRRRMERLEDKIAPAAFSGGMSIASGDVNGDNFNDIVVGAGAGDTPRVTVYSGQTGAIIRTFDAFESSFKGGVNVALGDVNGDGRLDVIVGRGAGGKPQVKAIDVNTGITLLDFLAYNKRFKGGVHVAAADVTGDKKADIITAAGPGGNAHVLAFDSTNGKAVLSFLAFDDGFKGGASIATGDVTGDGKVDIIVGAGSGGTPVVRVFEALNGNRNERNFLAFDKNYRGGVNVGTADVTNSKGVDIVAAAAAGGAPHVQLWRSDGGNSVASFLAFDSHFTGGVNVASQSLSFDGTGVPDLLFAPQSNGGSHVKGIDAISLQTEVSFFAFGDSTTKPLSTSAFAGNSDRVAPTIQITAPTGSPTQKTNLTVTGKAGDDHALNTVQVKVDNGTFQNLAFDSSGGFSFTTGFALNGTADGKHNLTFQATDRSGNSSSSTVSFTLKTVISQPTAQLADASDTGTKGDLITSTTNVTISGTAEANAEIFIVENSNSTRADSQGHFSLAAQLKAGANAFTVRATDSLGNTAQTSITITLNSAPTVSTAISDSTVAMNSAKTVLNLSNNFADVDIVNSIVRFNTSLGPIEIELFDQLAPITVQNFLNYLKRGDYDKSIFHRLVVTPTPFVLQGGGFQFLNDPSRLDAIDTDPPIQNEPGISNIRGTIAMAKLGGNPNSATSQFFFNLGDNSGNLDNQNGGFTVFAQVTSGMDIVDKLAQFTVTNQGGVFDELPMTNYTGNNFPTDTVFSNYAGITSATLVRQSDHLTFTVVSNSNSALVTTSTVGNNLTLSYTANQTGTATITVRATDADGQFVDQTFTVTVQ